MQGHMLNLLQQPIKILLGGILGDEFLKNLKIFQYRKSLLENYR